MFAKSDQKRARIESSNMMSKQQQKAKGNPYGEFIDVSPLLPKCIPSFEKIEEFFKREDGTSQKRSLDKKQMTEMEQDSLLIDLLTFYSHVGCEIHLDREFSEMVNGLPEHIPMDEKARFSGYMLEQARRLYSKCCRVPFETSPLNTCLVLEVIQYFDEQYFPQVMPLWAEGGGSSSHYQRVLDCVSSNTIYHKMLSLEEENNNAEVKAQLARLLLEAHSLKCYISEYCVLASNKKLDVQQPVVRKLFWHIAFLNQKMMNHHKWDEKKPSEFDRIMKQKIMEGEKLMRRAEIFKCTEECMERSEKTGYLLQKAMDKFITNIEFKQKYPEEYEIFALEAKKYRSKTKDALKLQDNGTSAVSIVEEFMFESRKFEVLLDFFDDFEVEHVVVEEEAPASHKKKSPSPSSQAKKRLARSAAKKEKAALEAECGFESLMKEILEEVVLDAKADVEKEEAEKLQKQKEDELIEQVMRMQNPAFQRRLMATLYPSLVGVLQESFECFICMKGLDFKEGEAQKNIVYMTCCMGGSWACIGCAEEHKPMDGHQVSFEREYVRQMAAMRKELMGP